MIRYHHRHEMPCTPSVLWQILVDLPAYSTWNAFTPRVRSTLKVGDPIALHTVLWGGWLRVTARERIVVYEPDRRIAWSMRVPGLLRTHREQRLGEQLEYTVYDSILELHGPLAGVVHLLFSRSLQSGLEIMAKGLHDRAAPRT